MGFLDKLKEKATEMGLMEKIEDAQKKITKKVSEVSNSEIVSNITKKVNNFILEEAKKYESQSTPQKERDEELLRLASVNLLNISKDKIAELEATKNMPVIYAAFVQANPSLYEPGGHGHAVLVFAQDAEKGKDIEFIKNVAKKLGDLKDAKAVPDDAKDLVNQLLEGDALFVEEVPASLTDGVQVIAAVEYFDDSNLPQKYIPGNRIIPVYMEEPAEIKLHSGIKLIKPKEYME